MKKTYFFLILAAIGSFSVSCVPQKKYKELETQHMKLQKRANELEKDTLTLGKNHRTCLTDKKALEELSAKTEETLSAELKKRQQEVAEKEKMLQDREKKLTELQDLLNKQSEIVNKLKKTVADALINFKADELSVNIKDGKVYVSLAEKLLFKSGSAEVDPKGKEALGKLAEVLKSSPSISVMIEGHTDSIPIKSGKFQDNWDLSVLRATSIVRILTKDNELDAKRVIASGRGEFFPVNTNETADGRSKNRRTEIILSPKLDELFQILEAK